MKFIITNRFNVEQYVNKIERYAVISITSPYNEFPMLQPGYIDVLRLKFLDMDLNDDYYSRSKWEGYNPISREDAGKIIDFSEINIDRVNLFIVNCNAGISRSSGIAAALSKIYNGDDSWVFKDRRYYPNMRVYRYILDEAFKRHLIDIPERVG